MSDEQDQALAELRLRMAQIEAAVGPAPGTQAAIDNYGNPSHVASGEIIESAWGNSVADRVVRYFPNSAARNTWLNAPEGAIAITLDDDLAWQLITPGQPDGSPGWISLVQTPTFWATIPGQTVISGTAGTGPGSPRILGFANPYRTWRAPFFNQGDINVFFKRAGMYRIQCVMKHNAWWAFFGGFHIIRQGTVIGGAVGQHSRGTWANPPGVIGFDGGHTDTIVAETIAIAAPEDFVQLIGYTLGGGDGSSNVGGDGSTLIIQEIRTDWLHELASAAIPQAHTLPDPLPPFVDPVIYIKRPGYPESYPLGEADPDYRATE